MTPDMLNARAHHEDDRLRADNERLHRLVEHLGHALQVAQAELAHKDRELTTLASQYELRRAAETHWHARQGEAAEKRRERLGWWEAAAWFALGAWLTWIASKGGMQ